MSNDLSERIKQYRINNNLTLDELAHKSGVSRATLARIENGQSNPTMKTIVKIAGALDTNPAELDERFVINLGGDYIHFVEDVSSERSCVTVPSGTPEAKALTLLHVLNTDGSKEWIKRGEEMAELDKYRKRKKD